MRPKPSRRRHLRRNQRAEFSIRCQNAKCIFLNYNKFLSFEIKTRLKIVCLGQKKDLDFSRSFAYPTDTRLQPNNFENKIKKPINLWS